MEKRSQWYQTLLIFSLIGVAALLGVFVYRELFPEYKLYQNAYLELEEFRSTYTGEPPPPFRDGVRQLVLVKDDKGPETIDRCISCHVALDLEHFSPTVVAKDINGHIRLDGHGRPLLVENENYVWKKLDDKIERLRAEGNNSEAERLDALKHVEVGHHHYDVTKVLRMHPLIGGETRPFELHPMEEYGCTSCHGGNGRGLVTDRAHGPVFDGHYHAEAHGEEPEFLEKDEANDPSFSKVFNHKPGHRLLFQTKPLLVGNLIEANCMQCHQSTQERIGGTAATLEALRARKANEVASVKRAISEDKQALATLVAIEKTLQDSDIVDLKKSLHDRLEDYRLNDQEKGVVKSQLYFLENHPTLQALTGAIKENATKILGSQTLTTQLLESSNGTLESVDQFIDSQKIEKPLEETVFAKINSVKGYEAIQQRLANVEGTVAETSEDFHLLNGFSSELDAATVHFHDGSKLFISQGCYACHRIAGYSRGGIGPELTEEGLSYPWFIKESITWPQADLKNSTMPNFHLDHDEVENLMTFLLAQKGKREAVSEFDRKASLAAWEAGGRLAIEQPVLPGNVYDVSNSMKIFATEGCAACHRLAGYDSNVGYLAEKNGADWDKVYESSQRFRNLFPEDSIGSQIVATINANQDEIDQFIVDDVRQNAILEQLQEENPGVVESFYSSFKFALRARNKEFSDRIAENPADAVLIQKEKDAYLSRVKRVMKVYIQEYGLGRLIGPRVNWSGLYRSDEWLIAHFRNPAAHSPKSIMPVFPFDDSKFYALTHMLNVLAEKNRDSVREIWSQKGFSPEQAYEIHCANCHGEYLHGNGPTAQWIYPIPKNLRNAYFLRNLTKENAINSIMHGVKGGPMPPWGEVASDKKSATQQAVLDQGEVEELVEWLFRSLPGSNVLRDEKDVPKWSYEPEDVLKELDEAKEKLESSEEEKKRLSYLLLHKEIEDYYVDLEPKVYRKELPRREVNEVFDVVGKGDEEKFYIKKEFYTPANIEAGQALFSFHCAVCHGDEGAGNGTRAEAMVDAKPRMLTNLDWLETRDDLRLLRSIKYGVRGTSMTPWGDYTSSLQRIQLVLFIRSLTSEKKLRDDLDGALFQAFEKPNLVIGKERAEEYDNLQKVVSEYQKERNNRRESFEKLQNIDGQPEEVAASYQKELTLLQQVKKNESQDLLLGKLMESLEKEREMYRAIGINLIERGASEDAINRFINFLEELSNRYTIQNGQLELNSLEQVKTRDQDITFIIDQIDREIESLVIRKTQVTSQLPSGEKQRQLEDVTARLKGQETLKGRIISGIEDAQKERAYQEKIFQQYKNGLGNTFT